MDSFLLKHLLGVLPEGLAEALTAGLRQLAEQGGLNSEAVLTLGNSAWYRLDEPPTNQFEVAIRELLPHVPGRYVVGAEWWVRITDSVTGKEWHTDRDESLYSLSGCVVHPAYASVLYLTSGGALTCICLSGSPSVTTQACAIAITPRPNSYIVFRGDLSHCVHAREDPELSTDLRITLLINWWANPIHSVVRSGHSAVPLQLLGVSTPNSATRHSTLLSLTSTSPCIPRSQR